MRGTPTSVGSALPSRWRSPASGAAQPRRTGLVADTAVLVGLTGLAALGYLLTKAPLYNPSGTIDPWLYTGLWTNFDQLYHAFSDTYFVSRIPWIVPGYVANSIFPPKAAYFVVHVPFFLGGGVALYLLCRRWLGVVPAGCAYVGLIASQLYWDGQRWDYEEAALVPFTLAAYAFVTPRTRRPNLRRASFAFAGIFVAAAVTTRITELIYMCGIPFFYWVARADFLNGRSRRQLIGELAAFVVGVAALLVAGGLFAAANGGPFWYIHEQIHVAEVGSGEGNQVPFHVWFHAEPYFLAPPFVLVACALVLLVGSKASAEVRRFQLAAFVWLAAAYTAVLGWEFLGGGFVFELGYYFSSFLAPLAVCLAAVVAGLVSQAGRRPAKTDLLALVLAASGVLGALLWFYRTDVTLRFARGLDHGSYLAALIFMVASLALVFAARAGGRRLMALGAVAAAACVAAVGFAIDASENTAARALSDSGSVVGSPGDLFSVAQELRSYLDSIGYASSLPTFWYATNDVYGRYVVTSLQSMWFYNYTFVGTDMPARTPDFRSRMSQFAPSDLVLLCEQPTCRGAGRSLASGGYRPRLGSRKLLSSGAVRVWVVIYRLLNPPTP